MLKAHLDPPFPLSSLQPFQELSRPSRSFWFLGKIPTSLLFAPTPPFKASALGPTPITIPGPWSTAPLPGLRPHRPAN